MAEPFLKWPGGKRWLVQRHSGLFPSTFRRYIEPFLGGGAVFFHLAPSRAILSDANSELINAYKCLQAHPEIIDRKLRRLHAHHGPRLYYRMRAMKPTSAMGKAIRFIYLNRTCFNGIYRVNHKGEFNVPMGSKDLVEYPDGLLLAVAERLRAASLKVADFEETIDCASKGDFVFVDPPYTVMHNNNNFIKYNASLFSWTDQVRLSSALRRAASRGALIMLSNADHDSVRTLYCKFGYHHRIDRSSVLAAESAHRCKTSELLITTYRTFNGEQAHGALRLARGGQAEAHA
ncbi:MAG: Dam family site-specific DNA-(adenine-N6)-methyltransferase [Planctomycetes bacterium]|nr:Dam family site-specific DNA-(adenine-N6)-methyltransferase [Planctomycetota bacterium]